MGWDGLTKALLPNTNIQVSEDLVSPGNS